MNKRKSVRWKRLDNAAKIFPPTSNRRNTKVFRFSCSLYEKIQPEKLQQALDRTMVDFPLYASIIRKGMFWYYFEACDLKPEVQEETKSPCSVMYDENKKNLLFQVTYYNKSINLEIYHALTDGTGALQFLRTLVLYYLLVVHQEVTDKNLSIDYDASMAQKEDDSFNKYFDETKRLKKQSLGKAYKVKGEKHEGHRLQVIRGTMSAKEVLTQAKAYNTTLTVFLGSLLVGAIGQEMAMRQRKKPVVISIPVNLRSYFQSASARNFFGVVNIGYYFKKPETPLEEIIDHLQGTLKKELTTERLQSRLNQLVALEHNYFTRVIPLILKKPTLKVAHHIASEEITTVLSNIGRVTMPEAIAHYIDTFDVCVSTDKIQMCVCSYGDKLSISFTSPLKNTEIQKNFFRELTSRGVGVSVTTNIGQAIEGKERKDETM
ncbi:MAG: hypothetical protein ACRDDX_04905 [Cellulosilyticaceae bacterium]